MRFETNFQSRPTDDPKYDDCVKRAFHFLEDMTNANEMWQPVEDAHFTKLENIAKKICRFDKDYKDEENKNLNE